MSKAQTEVHDTYGRMDQNLSHLKVWSKNNCFLSVILFGEVARQKKSNLFMFCFGGSQKKKNCKIINDFSMEDKLLLKNGFKRVKKNKNYCPE